MPERCYPELASLLVAVLLTAASVAGRDEAQRSSAPAPTATNTDTSDEGRHALGQLALSIHKLTLANGLKVVMNVTPGTPTCAVAVTERTPFGQSAQLVPPFTRASERPPSNITAIPTQDHDWRLLAERGGRAATAIDTDHTTRSTVLPHRELELALWFEGRRHERLGDGAVLTVVGDFDIDTVVPWVELYFGNKLATPPTGPSAPPIEIPSAEQYALWLAGRLGLNRHLAARGPKAEELVRVKRQIQRELLTELQSSGARAALLGRFEALSGDARLLSTEIDRYAAHTPSTVREAVARFLARTRPSQAAAPARGF